VRLNGKQKAAVLIAGILLVISVVQSDETLSAVHYWHRVAHPGPTDFFVSHWATRYTLVSAFFAPCWIACTLAAPALARRWPILSLIALSSFLIIEPVSCVSAPSLSGGGGFLGLEDLPFADAERAADMVHLEHIDAQLKKAGDDTGSFPTSEAKLKGAVGSLAFESSPYEQRGKTMAFDLELVLNRGVPYVTSPEKPGIVYYPVDPDGRQFVLTMSGLNAPIGARPSMMKAEAFVGEKQPWGGLLATQESLYRK
jgi:hypothetical protein